MPHAGGWAVAILETFADGVLLAGLSRRLGSWWLAAAIVMLGATSAPSAALSSVIWNPPIAEAFAKLTVASVLWPGSSSAPRAILTIVLAILAVQCHSSAILIAVPSIAWSMWAVARVRGMRAAAMATSTGILVIAMWAAAYIGQPTPPASPTASVGAAASIARVLSDPFHRLRPLESAAAVGDALEFLLLTPFHGTWLRWLLIAGVVTMVAFVRDGALLVASVAPVTMAVMVFALWQGQFGEAYWFLVILPAAMVCLTAPVIAASGRARQLGIAGLMALTAIVQPARAHHTWTAYRQPAYGPLARGVSAAAAAGVAVRDVTTELALPLGMDPLFMFSLVGGRLDAAAPVALVIGSDGGIHYVPAR